MYYRLTPGLFGLFGLIAVLLAVPQLATPLIPTLASGRGPVRIYFWDLALLTYLSR